MYSHSGIYTACIVYFEQIVHFTGANKLFRAPINELYENALTTNLKSLIARSNGASTISLLFVATRKPAVYCLATLSIHRSFVWAEFIKQITKTEKIKQKRTQQERNAAFIVYRFFVSVLPNQ